MALASLLCWLRAVTHEPESGVSLPGAFLCWIPANSLRQLIQHGWGSAWSHSCHPGPVIPLAGGKEHREKCSCSNMSQTSTFRAVCDPAPVGKAQAGWVCWALFPTGVSGGIDGRRLLRVRPRAWAGVKELHVCYGRALGNWESWVTWKMF